MCATRDSIENLSKDVFERHKSTGNEPFTLFICLDANKFVLLSFLSLIKTINPRVSTKPLPNDTKSPLPFDVLRSKTLLLKLPNHPRKGKTQWYTRPLWPLWPLWSVLNSHKLRVISGFIQLISNLRTVNIMGKRVCRHCPIPGRAVWLREKILAPVC